MNSKFLLNIKLSLISKYRTEIMGIAILWIILFHSEITFGASIFTSLFDFIKTIGYGGVDLFFFLSGFGLTCGWLKKQYAPLVFYQRRLLKILPPYIFTAALYYLIHCVFWERIDFKSVFLAFSGINFIAAKSYDWWFVPSIIICYLLFPIVMPILNNTSWNHKYKKFQGVCINMSIVSFAILICILLALASKSVPIIFFARLPSFFLGICLGIKYVTGVTTSKNDSQLNIIALALLLAGSILLFTSLEKTTDAQAWKYGLWWYPFICLSFPICLYLSSLLDLLFSYSQQCNIIYLSKSILRFFGSHSYELFLSHSIIFGLNFWFLDILNANQTFGSLNKYNFLLYFILFCVSLGLACLMKYMLNTLFIYKK